MSTTLTLDRALSSTSKLGHYGLGLPPQTVSVEEKETEAWQRGCMEFMLAESRNHDKSKAKDIRKIRMLSDEYDYSKDHRWAVDPLGLGESKDDLYGATDPIQHYPIVNTPLNTILGERINRQTQFFVISHAPESRNEYFRQKGEALFEQVSAQIQQRVFQELVMDAKNAGQPIDEQFMAKAQEQLPQLMPEAIQDYADTDYVDVIEKVHNRILKNVQRRSDTETEFIEGFRQATLFGKEAYMYEVVNNRLKVKNLSRFAVFYHKSPSNRWISEGQFAGYKLMLTPSSIIDSYRDKLELEDIQYLENKMNPSRRGGGFKSLTGIKSINYDTSVFADWHGNTFDNIDTDLINNMVEEYQLNGSSATSSRSAFGLFEVVQAYWKSFRKVGILEVFLEGDTPFEQLVDENYEPDEDAGEHVHWYYLNQVYQGTCIAGELIKGVEPYPHQIFDENDPDYAPLPIEGGEYNSFNGETISIFDLMLPWAELFDITAAELKKDMKKALGKVMFMSAEHIPDIEGFTMEKWMYWCKEFGIAWVGAGKKNSTFSHFSAQDMSFAEQLIAKMNMLDRIKMNCDAFAGFSQPRVAGVASSPTQGQDEQKLAASINQTEYYFWKHSKICERVLTHALNISKMLLRKSKDYTMLYDDQEEKYIEADIEMATLANSALYVLNSSQIVSKREAMRQMAAASAGKTGLPQDMGDIIMADTVNEITRKLKAMTKRQLKQEQQAQQNEEAKLQQDQQQHEETLQKEDEHFYATLSSKEHIAFMQTFSRQENNLKDDDGNGVPDILEQAKHFETVNDNLRKHGREQAKQDYEERKDRRQKQLDQRKLSIEKEKNDIARENMENDLAIAKTNAKNRGTKK
jgi:hypothetical protein